VFGCPDTCHTIAYEHLCNEIGGNVRTPNFSGPITLASNHSCSFPYCTGLSQTPLLSYSTSAVKWGHALWTHINIPDDVGVELLVEFMCDLFWGSKTTEKVFVPVKSGLALNHSCSCLYCTRLSQNPLFLHHPSTYPCYCPSLHPS